MNIREIIRRFQEERERIGLSQQDIATAAGISRQSISMYERGHYPLATDLLVKLLDAVGLELQVVEQATTDPEMGVKPPDETNENPSKPKRKRGPKPRPELKRRAKSPQGPPPPGDPRHGTSWCYSFYSCRCELCCRAKAAGSGRIYH